jgi:hypothetical protein
MATASRPMRFSFFSHKAAKAQRKVAAGRFSRWLNKRLHFFARSFEGGSQMWLCQSAAGRPSDGPRIIASIAAPIKP